MKESVNINPKWSKNKDEIWSNHFEGLTSMERVPKGNIVKIERYLRYYFAAAAVVIIMLVPFVFTKEISTQRGEHLTCNLPDGSAVTLNAESSISYKPILWIINRSVKMSGEVYFQVEKGERFTVNTDNGTVKVLCTKFNVLSREENFFVACISGKVEVTSQNVVILEKETSASLEKNGHLIVTKDGEIEKTIAWKRDIFYFTNVPLSYVIEEVSRQYDIIVDYPDISNYFYTGSFSKESKIEDVLDIISLPFGLKREKSNKGFTLFKQ